MYSRYNFITANMEIILKGVYMKTLTLCLTFAGLSLLSACQSTTKPQSTKSAEINQQTQYFSEAKIALDKLKEDISKGRKEQLTYFAPATFKQAIIQFDEATEEYMDIGKNGASSLNVFQSDTEQFKQAKQEIIQHIALARQKLKFAYSIKETAETTLAESFAHRDFLISIAAPKIYSKTYKKLSNRVDDLVEYIDDGKVSKAQEKQPKLLADMHSLEVLTVRYNALGQLDKDVAYIKKKRLAKYVPISHQQLLTARNNANAVLSATPRATNKINTAVKLAEFELAHLYHTTKEVNILKKIKTKDFEKYILDRETQLHSVSEALGTSDVRDLATTKQVAAIALQAGIIKDKLTTADAAILALQSDSTQSSEATESLRAEFKNQLVDLNTKYDALVLENSELNKQLQSKDIALVRLEAYKEAVIQVKGSRMVEKERNLQKQVQASKKTEALALADKQTSTVQEKASAAQQTVLPVQAIKETETAALVEKPTSLVQEKASVTQQTALPVQLTKETEAAALAKKQTSIAQEKESVAQQAALQVQTTKETEAAALLEKVSNTVEEKMLVLEEETLNQTNDSAESSSSNIIALEPVAAEANTPLSSASLNVNTVEK
jgi:hypothetical protein